ncbi:carboxypeptidase Q-like [Actinia tenebrosa]|uniref:Carboxypeptidase Q n=1 Tax=Actinia tenebrosa TaxID=6105 RepID=A0A6P8H8F7_ACTTE|nr:carboxypeptidase Q-like [Actinia tenebrosa]
MLSLNILNYVVIVSSIAILVFARASTINNGKSSRARLVEKMKTDAQNHGDIAERIIKFITSGPAKHQVYDRLATFTDTFGNRIAGSQNLENAIDYMLEELKKDGLENVHGENVKVPHWVRGSESATMLSPRRYSMNILGLGSSVGTPPEGITADVLVVKSFDELKTRAKEAEGKIVVFNEEFVSYGETVSYRDFSAVRTAEVGGVASLIRSVAPFSINSPHTGWQDYSKGVKKIPTACITIEDAEMLGRMAARGTKITINLKMEAKTLPPVTSRNTVAEIVGSKYPDQVVLVSGHLDSWDVGQGAMDDGGGAFISWQALSVIRQLKLRPKRTLRMVMWTGEEEGYFGGLQYYNVHKVNISNFDLVMESDIGTFKPLGLDFNGSADAVEVMKEVLKLLKPINASMLNPTNVGGDITNWVKNGVPGGSLSNQNDKYFYFHHTDGDTMTVLNADELDLCAALWAVVAYTVADMEDMLPR